MIEIINPRVVRTYALHPPGGGCGYALDGEYTDAVAAVHGLRLLYPNGVILSDFWPIEFAPEWVIGRLDGHAANYLSRFKQNTWDFAQFGIGETVLAIVARQLEVS